jgi:hypothetical protein
MFRISDAIRSTSTADGAVLLDIRHGQILGLNRMGSAIFRMLERGLDPAQIAREISKECGANLEEVRADVRVFIERLQESDVLEVD